MRKSIIASCVANANMTQGTNEMYSQSKMIGSFKYYLEWL